MGHVESRYRRSGAFSRVGVATAGWVAWTIMVGPALVNAQPRSSDQQVPSPRPAEASEPQASVPTGASEGVQSGEAPRSIWDGIYTEAQAERGRDVYLKQCSTCHSADLRGGETAPPLLGRSFKRNIVGTVAEVYENMRATMPEESPGGLTDKVYIEILAHIFEANGFPPGDQELETDVEDLNAIRIPVSAPR